MRRAWLATLWALVLAAPAGAQESALVEAIAPVLAAEDARRFDRDLFARSIQSTEPVVRRTAAMAVGRLRDPRGVSLLPPLLVDPDSTVRAAAVFAFGLIGDSSATPLLLRHFRTEPLLDEGSAVEAVTALARIGDGAAREFLGDLLAGAAAVELEDPTRARRQAALEAWRLGSAAPVGALLPLVRDTASDMRWRAVYSLARLRAPSAATYLAQALRDPLALTRAFAVRAFVPAFVDSTELSREAATGLVAPLLDDEDPGVRINALRTLGDLQAAHVADRAARLLRDPMPNVRVQAAASLGAMGGPAAVAALAEVVREADLFAVQREALLALAALDTAQLRAAADAWATDADWTRRMVWVQAAAAAGWVPPLRDADARVRAAALTAWGAAEDSVGAGLLDAARAALGDDDPVLRAAAAGILARRPSADDVARLAGAWRRALRDPIADAATGAAAALRAIGATGTSARDRVAREFVAAAPQPSHPTVLAWVRDNWPALAARWTLPAGVPTGRTLQDYREIARRFVVAPDSVSRPVITIEVDQRGPVQVRLLGPDAPLTVAHIVSLIDRQYFDALRWHRVVPSFVAQTGDPRGDGWGGPGGAIRDEPNRVRYFQPVMGMAHSGPDTGGSQWFINLSPQPHLDGGYTVVGEVVGSYRALWRITQGDRIRTVRR